MPVSEFHRAQTIRLVSDIVRQLGQSDAPAIVVAQAESVGGEIPIPHVDLLKEESEAQGLHFILHTEDRGELVWYAGMLSKTRELAPAELEFCLKAARGQEKPSGA